MLMSVTYLNVEHIFMMYEKLYYRSALLIHSCLTVLDVPSATMKLFYRMNVEATVHIWFNVTTVQFNYKGTFDSSYIGF